jgi:hypothetical protein
MEKLLQDLRYAFRSLARQPSFAVTAIATLALGIGATTAIFSVVNAVVIRPLPYADPDRIVAIMHVWTRTGTRGATVSAPDFEDWKDRCHVISPRGARFEWIRCLHCARSSARVHRFTSSLVLGCEPEAEPANPGTENPGT